MHGLDYLKIDASVSASDKGEEGQRRGRFVFFVDRESLTCSSSVPERNYNMWIPGFGTDDIRGHRRSATSEAHKSRMALIRKTLKKY